MVIVKIKELELNITYAYCWDEEYASKILHAQTGDIITGESEGVWVVVKESTVTIREGDGGGQGCFDRKEICRQIRKQLDNPYRTDSFSD